MGIRASEADAPEGSADRVRRPSVRWLVPVLAAFALVGYVLVGFPSSGFPGRASPGELRHVQDTINRAYLECALDDRATIDWLWGQVDVPSGTGVVGTMPDNVDLTRDELAHATGTMNFFWAVCP